MPKPRLVITTDNLLPRWDGIARTLSELVPRLARRFDIVVIGPDFGPEPRMGKVVFHRFPVLPWRFGDINFAWFHPRVVRRLVEGADVVFNQTIGPIGMAGIRAARKNDVPCASYIHSIEWELAAKSVKRGRHIVEAVVKWLARRLYRSCQLIIVPNKEVEDLLSGLGVESRKALVPLGVDTTKFQPAKARAVAKWKLGIPPTTKVIGFTGRIGREKDIPTLYKAFKIIQRQQPDTKLLIVGGGIETDRYASDPDVLMPGPQDKIERYLQAMDIFVLPSLTETSSLATLEAMACGLPVVVTPVGSMREYVKDGYNGFLFPRRDFKSLAEKLDLLVRDTELRARLGRAARRTVMERHQWDKVAAEIGEKLLGLARKGGNRG